MQGRLVERGGERAGTVYLLKDGVTTLRRSVGNDIFLPSRHISRRHAELLWEAGHPGKRL